MALPTADWVMDSCPWRRHKSASMTGPVLSSVCVAVLISDNEEHVLRTSQRDIETLHVGDIAKTADPTPCPNHVESSSMPMLRKRTLTVEGIYLVCVNSDRV